MPLALWPTTHTPPPTTPSTAATEGSGSTEDDGGMSAELARRILAEFSHPGEVILDLACTSGTLLTAAAALRRRAIGITPDDPSAQAAIAHCEQTLDGDRRVAVEVITADLSRLPQLRPDLNGAADLAVLAVPTLQRPPAAALDAARRLLRPGGLLVTVTRGARRAGAFHDTAGEMVRLARASGFGYTQHVIALRAPIDGDHLTPTPTSRDRARVRADLRAGRPRHLAVHQDVCVFVAPTRPDAAADDATEVIA